MIVVTKFTLAGKLDHQIKRKLATSDRKQNPLSSTDSPRSIPKLTRSLSATCLPHGHRNPSPIPFRTIPSHPKDHRGFPTHFCAHAVEGGQAVQPGPGPRAGGSVHTPHQPLRRGRGGIAPAAARRPAASPAPTGQERSPRPPSGCRGQFSGDSARPSAADLSQLAFAAQLSNIHLWDFSPAAPFHEPGRGRGIPSGGLSSLSEKRAGERQREQCVTGPPTGTLCSVSPLRVPNGPRGKGRSGCPLTSENPRHGRLRLRGARDRGSNRCLRAGRGTVQAPAGPGSARLRGGGCRSPGGGGTRTRSALSRPGAEWSRVGCPPARPPPAARCHVLAVAAPSD
ncbi:translation initiation factor IF-2-like [Ursus americanus]|uniref:translation initiation factor IF-2-like n=1 Tax=Ursus americanus TaxID=9643 RepID=UPI001E67CA32|nr:translation initiation factor IF-2-like [Ursus americanus]